MIPSYSRFVFFFFNDTATTEIYTLSLHDALPISTHAPGIWMKAGQRDSGTRAKRTSVFRPATCLPCTKCAGWSRSEEHTSELQSHLNLVCRLLLEKKKTK